ncbi:hypothetical protein GCM10027418_28740 [Mariniluteicoccus endophyticus]
MQWALLPPDASSAEVYERAVGLAMAADRFDRDVMIERIEMIRATNPGRILVGASGLSRYVGFQYTPTMVALENFHYGNALYLMYEDWGELSRRSRRDLLAGSGGGFDRVVHSGKWRDVFWRLLRAKGFDPNMAPSPTIAGT